MKKVLLIQPPQWYPVSPHLAVPLLIGQIKRAGFDVKAVDLNVKFFNYVLRNEHLKKADKEAKEILENLKEKFSNADFESITQNGSFEEKNLALKYLTIDNFYKENEKEIEQVLEETDNALHTLKEPTEFYCPEKLMRAKHIVRLALRIASMPFAPNEIDLDNYFANPLLSPDWENIKFQCGEKSLNMFYDFLCEKSNEIAEQGNDIIGISMTDLSQLIPVFTLAGMLKEKTRAKIVLGGNYATQICEDMLRHKDIFTDYIDYLVVGDSETSLVDLCKAIVENRNTSEVEKLSYYCRQKKAVVSTKNVCNYRSTERICPEFR